MHGDKLLKLNKKSMINKNLLALDVFTGTQSSAFDFRHKILKVFQLIRTFSDWDSIGKI